MSSSTQSAQRSSSRPTTPHRLVNKSVLGAQSPKQHFKIDGSVPISEEQLVELSDSFAILDDNLIKVNLINESIVKFNESFSSLLYGLLTNSLCTEFTEAPTSQNFDETYFDLDSQIRLTQGQIDEFLATQIAERSKDIERGTSAPKKGPLDTRASAFKKPLTSATLARLSKQKETNSPHRTAARGTSKSTNTGDISYMTNDSFIENPSTSTRLKRKNQFGTGGSSVPSSSTQSKIPIRKPAAAPKPAWK